LKDLWLLDRPVKPGEFAAVAGHETRAPDGGSQKSEDGKQKSEDRK
jgi:hypothetical protein